MSDSGLPPQPPNPPRSDDHDAIARVLRLAGERPAAPAARSARIRSAVHAHWSAEVHTARRTRTVLWVAVSLAAAAVLVVVFGRGWQSPAVRPSETEQTIATLLRAEGQVRALGDGVLSIGARLAPGTDLETGDDGRAALSLADGSSVRLDSRTRVWLLSGPVLALDRGAIYIDSGSRRTPRSALEVRTRLGLVRDLGTQFEVRLQDGGLRLSVREGLATLLRDDRSFAAPAGTRLLVGTQGTVETHAMPIQGPDWDWVLSIAPAFDLEGRTLGEYLDWVSRETGWRVEFADPTVARDASTIILHGSVTGLRPDETPPAVLPACGLRQHFTGSTLVIERQDGARSPS